MSVRKEDVEAVKSYLRYIAHLEEPKKKSLLNAFLRRHVQDISFAPLISDKAFEEAQKKGITVQQLKSIKFPYASPGSGIPKEIRALFTNGDRGKQSSVKIFHFEHNIPAAQGAAELLELDLSGSNLDTQISGILKNCTLCLVTVEEDNELTKRGWTKKRPPDAYKTLGIQLKPISQV
jgi:hypothetical protein